MLFKSLHEVSWCILYGIMIVSGPRKMLSSEMGEIVVSTKAGVYITADIY